MVSKKTAVKKQTLSDLIKQDAVRLREYCSSSNFKTEDGKLATFEDVLKDLASSKDFQQVLKTMVVSKCRFGENAVTGRNILEIHFDNDETCRREHKALNSAFVEAVEGFAEYLRKKQDKDNK